MSWRWRQRKTFMPGTGLYSIAVGPMPFLPWRRCRMEDYFYTLQGFIGIYIVGSVAVLFFTTLNAAKIARNLISVQGDDVGDNICFWRANEDSVLEYQKKAE